jgi:hypothetical protein
VTNVWAYPIAALAEPWPVPQKPSLEPCVAPCGPVWRTAVDGAGAAAHRLECERPVQSALAQPAALEGQHTEVGW